MRLDDFCRLTPREFGAVLTAYRECREADMHDSWERMRLLACITVQPHVRKKMTPTDLLKFPWEETRKPKTPRLSKEEIRRRMEEALKMV